MTVNSSARSAGKATMTDAPEKPGVTASIEIQVDGNSMTEVEFVARRILEKVFQNEPSKQNLVEHIAAVAVKAQAEYFEMYVTTHLWPQDGYGMKRT